MKKVFDQTVRDIKREVNKKVLKVPGIEQKILDATSNEPWGPHGTLLADIAQATRNYHEYQMIMAVIWKRINDTGKNWRHVYKALTVLEYLVGHGSERVIDEIREHAYQISTLADFQYIDSSGTDQGSNVRKKSQSLVVLVNDKERIIEVRQKAAANRDKFRNTSVGGMYRPSSYSSTGGYGDKYDDDRYEGRYGSRDEDRNGYGYGREREYNYRDDDRYGRYGDSYSRDGDRHGRDYEERYSRDGYRDDDYRGRSRSIDDYGSRSRSSDRDRGFHDDGQPSSRDSARVDDQSQDGRRHERKFSEQNIAPPCYEEDVSESRSPAHGERNGEISAASAPGVSSPAAPRASSPPAPKAASPSASNNPSQATNVSSTAVTLAGQEVEVADEFDPRGPGSDGPIPSAAPAVATTSNIAEMDLLGSLSDSFAANPLAIMPVASAATTSEADAQANFSVPTFAATQPASNVMNQPFEDPFGDNPFKAIPASNDNDTISAQQQTSVSAATFQPTVNQNAEMPPTVPRDTVNKFDFGDAFSGMTHSAVNVQPASTNSQFMPQEPTSHQETDILADILPPSGPSPTVTTQTGFSALAGELGEPTASIYGSCNSQAGSVAPIAPNVAPNMSPHPAQFNSGNFLTHGGSTAPFPSNMAPQTPAGPGTQFNNGNLLPQQISVASVGSPSSHHLASGPTPQYNNGNFLPQGFAAQVAHHTSSGPPLQFNNANFLPQQGSASPAVSQAAHYATGATPQFNDGNFLPQQGSTALVGLQVAHQTATGATPQFNNGNLMPQQGSAAPVVSQVGYQAPAVPAAQHNSDLFSQGSNTPMASQTAPPSSTGSLAIVPQSSKDKFETKSAVWADTLNRGLVNLNISGPKINPLADIGIDFDAINRKEKRMEKPTTAAVTSTVTMGKAMGSGSGIGRAGASALRAPPNSMMSPGMGMGAGMNMGMGMGGVPGMGGYGQPMGMGMGMGVGMNMNQPMVMGMGQGGRMQSPGSAMPGGYNPMMGTGGYTQQPYGGGYR